MIIKNKVVLVTGASEGIGFEIAKQLTQAGAKVIGTSRNIESKDINEFDVKNCDVSKANEVKKLFEFIQKEYKSLDIAVNNAGVWQKLSEADIISEDVVHAVIDTNLKGTIFVTQQALPLLRKKDEAAIVNIISKSGVTAQQGQSIYTASKYGVRGFTDVLREDLKDTNIYIMAVYQAGIDTEMFRKTGEDFNQDKFTKPEDLAAQIVYAMSAPQNLWVHELRIGYK